MRASNGNIGRFFLFPRSGTHSPFCGSKNFISPHFSTKKALLSVLNRITKFGTLFSYKERKPYPISDQMDKKLLFPALLVLAVSLNSCKKSIDEVGEQTELAGNKVAPDDFTYSTTKEVTFNVQLLNDSEKPLTGVMVAIYDPANVSEGTELTKVLSDKDGYIRTKLRVSSSLNNFVVDARYFGLLGNVKVYAQNGIVTAIIGGSSVASGNITKESNVTSKSSSRLSAVGAGTNSISSKTVMKYDLDDFDNLGRPIASKRYTPDAIDWSKLKALIDNSLPERQYVAAKYIATEAPANLSITALSDVWISFVHEGADYRNSFGFYTYTTGNPPKTNADIDTIHMVFPNASLKGHNGVGNMVMGDKVKIGRFPAGVSIGFVLFQNAYNDDRSISTKNTTFYSNEDLNPEDAKLKRHNVLLHNASQGTFLIGFEDIDRRSGYGSDQDFNDLVVYAQSNPVEAISPANIPYLEEKVVDSDGDGVPDDRDEYPNDKNRAYNRYYPSKSIWGTTAFEDLWPSEGDYDLNDLVVSYQYKFAMSSANKVVDLNAQYKTLAAGASQTNGFGVQLPLNPSAISKVTGSNLTSGYIKQAANGTEANQSEAVVIAFDNHRSLFGGASSFINTLSTGSYLTVPTTTIDIEFSSPLDENFTTNAPFNPFMISNQERGKEVHLVGKKPTSLADLSLLGTQSDNSKPNKDRYYLTAANRPFAIDIYGSFIYPQERVNITDAYPHFAAWASSGGKAFDDWFSNTAKGYRNESVLYIRK